MAPVVGNVPDGCPDASVLCETHRGRKRARENSSGLVTMAFVGEDGLYAGLAGGPPIKMRTTTAAPSPTFETSQSRLQPSTMAAPPASGAGIL